MTAIGMTTAATQRTIVAVSHLLTRTLVRDTGLEIVQASVPLSRSARSRLIVAKMAARTMNWVPIAKSRLSIGRTDRTLAGPSLGSAGMVRMAHAVIRELAAARAKTVVVMPTTSHGRLPCIHSARSFRTRLRMPSNRGRPRLGCATAAGSSVVAFMPHAPWSR